MACPSYLSRVFAYLSTMSPVSSMSFTGFAGGGPSVHELAHAGLRPWRALRAPGHAAAPGGHRPSFIAFRAMCGPRCRRAQAAHAGAPSPPPSRLVPFALSGMPTTARTDGRGLCRACRGRRPWTRPGVRWPQAARAARLAKDREAVKDVLERYTKTYERYERHDYFGKRTE